jgi:hypothetical protein
MMTEVRGIAALAVFAAMALADTAGAAPDSPEFGWPAVRPYVEQYRAAPLDRPGTRIIYDLLEKIESREIRLESRADADSLATFLSTLLTPRSEVILRHRVIEFFSAYPHPAAADSLWAMHARKDRSSLSEASPLRILADLGDRRIVPDLIEGALAGKDGDFDRLAPMADDSVVARLKTIAAGSDADAERRLRAEDLVERLAEWRKHPLINAEEMPARRRERLVRDGFVVSPAGENEMFELYGPEYPFVTTDVIWHTWMILMRAARTEMEQLMLAPLIAEFGVALRSTALTVRSAPPSGPNATDADSTLLADLALGRRSLRIDSEADIRNLIEIVAMFAERDSLNRRWNEMDALLGSLFGPADDLTLAECTAAARSVARNAYGSDSPAAIRRIARDGDRVKLLVAQLATRPRARIAADPSMTSNGRDPGLRLLGQRYTRPIAYLQEAIERDGGWPPDPVDVVRAIRAEVSTDEDFRGSPLDPAPSDPLSSLSEGFIACARDILASPAAGAPRFMTNRIWRDKETNCVLGAWAELQNLSAAYVKDANTYLSASRMTDEIHGYVEPVPAFYARLDSLNRRITARFDVVGLWDRIAEDQRRVDESTPSHSDRSYANGSEIRPARSDFETFSAILSRLEQIASAELRHEPQSIDDGFFLKGLYRQLMYLSFQRSGTNVAQSPMSVVATVANEHYSRRSVQIAVGQPWRIEVAVHAGNREVVCRGAIYSSYGFLTPMDQRYDDEEWRVESRLSDPADRLPWLAQSGRVGAWYLTPADLDSMRLERNSHSLRLQGQAIPHRWTGLRAATLEKFDPAALIAVINDPVCSEQARELALVRLADDGTDPRVLAALTPRVDSRSRVGRGFDEIDIILSLRGLGACGRKAVPVLEAARSRLIYADQWRKAGFHRQIERSLARIAEWPEGRRFPP